MAEGFFEYGLPRFHVGSDVVKLCAVDLQVQRRCWWTVEDCVEGYVSAQPMRQEKAGDDALMDDV